jgi:peptidoglycan/xylan/chitin deacetylase (PgdA/CDA1 family)
MRPLFWLSPLMLSGTLLAGVTNAGGSPAAPTPAPAPSVTPLVAAAPAADPEVERALANARHFRKEQAQIHFNVFSGGCNRDRKVALTFDDGPDPKNTPKILDVLKAEHAPATFFVIGMKAEKHPELVLRESAEGHDVGNHTYHHLELTEMGADGVRFEIERTNQTLEKILGGPTRWFRAPGCHYTTEALQAISGEKMVRIDSTDNPGDWAHPTPDQIVRRSLRSLSRGDVILCHDRIAETALALPRLIHEIRARGYQIVPLADLALEAQNTPGFHPMFCQRADGVRIDRMAKVPTATLKNAALTKKQPVRVGTGIL